MGNRTHSQGSLALLCMLLISVLVSCGDDAATDPLDDCESNDDCSTGSFCVEGLCASAETDAAFGDAGVEDVSEESDSGAEEDAGEEPDTAVDDSGVADTDDGFADTALDDASSDVADTGLEDTPGDVADTSDIQEDASDGSSPDAPDVADPDAADATDADPGCVPGTLGCACEASSCAEGECVRFDDADLCSLPCDSGCPDGTECSVVEVEGELEAWCGPADAVSCGPCTTDAECPFEGAICVHADFASVCSVPCTSDPDCPTGYECETISREEDGVPLAYRVCMPVLEFCGDCYDQDEDGYGVGSACLDFDCDDADEEVFPGAFEVCNDADDDCDGETDEDYDLEGDLANCGACGVSCDIEGGDETCVDGVCTLLACDDGFGDCNDRLDDGCETSLLTPISCGACGVTCDLDFVETHACETGVCEIDTCVEGQADCNGEDADGCETGLGNILNCGFCGDRCEFAGADATCNLGTCELDACFDGFADCDLEMSTGCEIEIASDPSNCGECGVVCSEAGVDAGRCDDGLCIIDTCTEGFASCDEEPTTGCETDISTVANCGDCGVVCDIPGAINLCGESGCSTDGCAEGFIDLDGDLDTDTTNGCEYACTFVSDVDLPDDRFVDANCDGVDGDLASSVFLSPTGDNGADGLTPETAVQSPDFALAAAVGSGRTRVLAAAGEYPLASRLDWNANVSIHGGYGADFTSRSDTRTVFVRDGRVAVRVDALSEDVVFDGLRIATVERGPEDWTVALQVTDCGTFFELHRSEVEAGNGGDGVPGARGGSGTAGGDGANGDSDNGGNGGSGGGGNGGDGNNRDNGDDGADGSQNGAFARGVGGSGGRGNRCFDGDAADYIGEDGGDGGDGAAGDDGGAGDGIGSFIGLEWSPSIAEAGGTGGLGAGGGGGGGGGGEECNRVCFRGSCVCESCGRGRGGGGGGGGGTGGLGGSAGTAGGASIGMIVRGSTVSLSDSVVSAGLGGDGGAGGAGGNGGAGGAGGAGATNSDRADGDGGDGGDGGAGGTGGCAGGGGGGPSVAVWGLDGASAVVLDIDSALVASGGGEGGNSCGNAGEDGITSDTRDVAVALP